MTLTNKHLSIGAACLMASLAAGCAGAGASQSGSDTLRCEVATSSSGGMTSIEGLVHAGKSVTGTYSLSITAAGTNIRQGGDFEARSGETVPLGSAMLGGTARTYDVKLDVKASGVTVQCSERVRG